MINNKIFNILFSFVSIFIIYFLIKISNKDEKTFQFVTIYEYDNDDTLNLENIKKEISKQKILFSDIVLRQVILETGNLECNNCCLDNNNLFGFRYKGEYLKFDYWQQSVQYYKWWQSRKYKEGDYYKFLDDYYAEDVDYIKKLKTIKN